MKIPYENVGTLGQLIINIQSEYPELYRKFFNVEELSTDNLNFFLKEICYDSDKDHRVQVVWDYIKDNELIHPMWLL